MRRLPVLRVEELVCGGGREDEGQPLGQGGQLTLRQDDNVVIHGGLHTILQS